MIRVALAIFLALVALTALGTITLPRGVQTGCTTGADCELPEYLRCPPGCQDPYVGDLPCICTVPQTALTPFVPKDYPGRLP